MVFYFIFSFKFCHVLVINFFKCSYSFYSFLACNVIHNSIADKII